MVMMNSSPGICSTMKSKPCRVRRSLSGTSLDVHGTVVMEKIWMFEGMKEGLSVECLSEDYIEKDDKDDWCPKHCWFQFTNLLSAQQCAKCSKRILPKRTAHKCTGCKRICHLKCAVENSNDTSATFTLSSRKPKNTMDFQEFVPREAERSCRYTSKQITNKRRSVRQREMKCGMVEELDVQEEFSGDQSDHARTKQQMADFSWQPDVHNASVHSQTRQRLTSMKHGIVKRCLSIKEKVKTLKGKTVPDSSTSTNSVMNSEEQVEQDRAAWVRSPVRTRLRERQLELRRESVRSKARMRGSSRETSVMKVGTSGTQMRNSRRHRFQVYDLDLTTLRDRVMEIEERVCELETTIPQEIGEWHKLQQKFRGNGIGNANWRMELEQRTLEHQIIHETHPKHLEAMGGLPSASSGTTSDDVYLVPDQQGSSTSQDEPDYMMPGVHHLVPKTSHMVHKMGHMVHSPIHEESLPSEIPNSFQLDVHHDIPGTCSELQTSTPVTDRELSFLSASRPYQNTHQIRHTNITQISVEHSYSEQGKPGSKAEVKFEKSMSFEKAASSKVLSPEQIAVKNFLEKRRRSSPRKSSDGMSGYRYSSPTRHFSRSPERESPHKRTTSNSWSESPLGVTNQSCLYNSPPIASSTFQEGNGDYSTHVRSDMSPLSFTFRHDPGDMSRVSFAKVASLGDISKLEESKYNGGERTTSSGSNLSYTFRNDSQMIQTNADEDLPGYTSNCPPCEWQGTHVENIETSSDDNYAAGTRILVEADIEMERPGEQTRFAKRDSLSPPVINTTDDAMSLTNVTAFTADFVNSFAETVDSAKKSRRVNKNVYMFDRDGRGNPIKSRYTQSHEKMDAIGDWKKPPIPGKRYSSTSEIDFLKEAKQKLDIYKTRNSGELLTSGVCLEKLPRPSVLHTNDTDSTEEVSEHIVQSYAPQETFKKLQATPAYASPKGRIRSPKRGSPRTKRRSLSPKSRTVSPRRSRSPKRRSWSPRRSSCPKRMSPSPRERSQSPQRGSPSTQRRKSPQTRPILPHRISKHSSQTEVRSGDASPVHYHPTHANIKQVNSTSEFEDFERELQDESVPHRRSKSLTNLLRYQQFPSSHCMTEKCMSCTNSVDGETRSIINESARYHFLHDKGMIKISSPSLKIMTGSPATRRKYEPEHKHIDEESSDMVHSGSESELSGLYVDNNFQILGKTSSDSKQTHSEVTGTELTEKISESSQKQQERELFEQCLNTADDNHEVWDNVLSWMNKECDDGESAELEHELGLLMEQENGVLYETDSERDNAPGSHNLVDDSVYYSFQGQSEELRGALSPLHRSPVPRGNIKETDNEDDVEPGLLYVICNGNVQDVANYLNSDRTISEGEIKEALIWTIDKKNYKVTLLLLEDICQLIKGSEGDMCVDVFPAYLEKQRWQPVFVILTKQNFQGEWDSFMGFPVYRRRYDLVSSEAVAVINSDYVRTHPLSVDNIRTVKKAISSVNLQRRHSKVTVINASPCRSRKDGQVLEKGLCIVVHCLIKGFIPFNEDPFPREIDGIPVDVREGYFSVGVATPPGISDIHQQLRDLEACSRDESRDSSNSLVSECRSGSSSSNRNKNSCESGSSSLVSLRSRKVRTKNDKVTGSPRAVTRQYMDNLNIDKDERSSANGETLKLTDEVIDKIPDVLKCRYGNKSTERNQDLLMGTSVDPAHVSAGGGSLGGIVMLPDNSIGLLTSAHLVDPGNSSDGVCQPANTGQNADANSLDCCEELLKLASDPGSHDTVGVDAAVVKVTSRAPIAVGVCPSRERST